INVACHSDAHEQAKWFGDDIDLKSAKYDHEMGSARGAVAVIRKIGAGRPPIHRFRVGLEFAIAGRRHAEAMIAQHARLPQALAVTLTEQQFDSGLEAIAHFVDLKSPYTLGHSRAVADLTAATASQLGLREPEVHTVRRAALVHDFGRLGVSNAILDKQGPLGVGEWERLRGQPYLTERMLSGSPSLAPLGAIA